MSTDQDGFTVFVSKHKKNEKKRKMTKMEESLREKLLNNPHVVDVPEDATLEELIALEKKYFPSNANAKKPNKTSKKPVSKKLVNGSADDSDSDAWDSPAPEPTMATRRAGTEEKDKPKEHDNPFQKARIAKREAWTSSQIADVVDRVLNSVPGHVAKYPLFVQRFREFTGHGWTKQHQQHYGSLKDWIAGSARFAVAPGDVVCRLEALEALSVSNPGATVTKEATTAAMPSGKRDRDPSVVGIDGMFDDKEDANDKDRGCAPSATKWGLQAPLLILLFFVLTAAVFAYAIEQQWVPVEVVDAVPAFRMYRTAIKHLRDSLQ